MKQSAKSACLRSEIILQLILLMAPHSANTEAECSKQSPQLTQRAALPALCRIQLLITVSRFDHYEKLPKIAPFREILVISPTFSLN